MTRGYRPGEMPIIERGRVRS